MIKKTLPAIFVFACSIFSTMVQAEAAKQLCDDAVVADIGKYLDVDNFSYPEYNATTYSEKDGAISASACKVWPKDKNITIVAFAYDYDAGTADEKALFLALINTRTHDVIASYKSSIEEDADMRVDNDSIHIDTARYDLAKGVTAIGLDVSSGYIQHPCEEGGVGAQRTLFVPEGNQLRPVLKNFALSSWQYTQGGNPRCTSPDAPEPIIEDIKNHIIISRQSQHGFANLIITQSLSYDGGELKEAKHKSSQKAGYELRYDGKIYKAVITTKK
jgi:hypothetical protein